MTKRKDWSNCKMFTENNESLTYYEVLERASSFLAEIGHSSFVGEWLMRERLGWTKTELILNYQNKMEREKLEQFEEDFKAFLKGQPMQQVIGHEWFYDRKFKVTAATLIPRPETEEWLDRVLTLLPNEALNVLDIGTGTGVLALTHKLERADDTVTATDISGDALEVARENADALEADVHFVQGSLFEPVQGETFDVILCNPPYISQDELAVMDQSVIDYEPESALFAEDDGLAIYKELAGAIAEHLNPGGKVFLEIGYKQGPQVAALFKQALPQATVEVWQDFNKLDRVVAICTPVVWITPVDSCG